eukprot:Partr_v1_DN25892_c2_g1_i2_m2977 putative WD repeatcontaining protein
MATVDIGTDSLDIAYHPSTDRLIVATIEGEIKVVNTSEKEVECTELLFKEDDVARCVSWHTVASEGAAIVCSKKRVISLYDTHAQKSVISLTEAHEFPICRAMSIHENLFATGDDEGIVKIWDSRSMKQIRKYHDNEDYISDFAYNADKRTLLAAGGDGYLSVFDIRKKELLARSDNMDCEIFSVEIIKYGRKALVGMENGVIGVFSWGDWGDIKDRIPGHPASVDSMVKYGEDTIFTGSSDGFIRALDVYPTDFVGVLGDQGEYPVERMSLSHDGHSLATSSHDTFIRLFDVSAVMDDISSKENDKRAGGDSELDSDDSDHVKQSTKKQRNKPKTSKKLSASGGGKKKNSFFDGLEDDD